MAWEAAVEVSLELPSLPEQHFGKVLIYVLPPNDS